MYSDAIVFLLFHPLWNKNNFFIFLWHNEKLWNFSFLGKNVEGKRSSLEKKNGILEKRKMKRKEIKAKKSRKKTIWINLDF